MDKEMCEVFCVIEEIEEEELEEYLELKRPKKNKNCSSNAIKKGHLKF